MYEKKKEIAFHYVKRLIIKNFFLIGHKRCVVIVETVTGDIEFPATYYKRVFACIMSLLIFEARVYGTIIN